MKKAVIKAFSIYSGLIVLFFFKSSYGQTARQVVIPLLPNEYWWGGAVNYGYKLPFDAKSNFSFDLWGDASGNQSAPLFISSKGRWLWSDDPFSYTFKNDSLLITGRGPASIESGTAGTTLASAYQEVSKKYFPSNGKWPDSLFVTSPQYNLWIELEYNPTQERVLNYVSNLKKYGFPPGVLMIDDNWTKYYGQFDFDKYKFPDAKAMVSRLHAEGYKVVVWICPFISPDSEIFRECIGKKLLLMSNEGVDSITYVKATTPLLISWWNGYSACLDLTNPEAISWLNNKLKALQDNYGIDGFKFDAGDPYFYNNPKLLSYKPGNPNQQLIEWMKLGLQWPLNEYRAGWKMAGEPLVQRLADKNHTWADLRQLIPNTISQQLSGYLFTCPDMIGGGNISSFWDLKTIDQKLVVRSAQIHALLPMMQFSVAPWRILDTLHLKAMMEAVNIRKKYLPQMMQVLRASARSGEPAVRPLCYNYPGSGYEKINDQYMFGTDLLIAPIVTESDTRQVILPDGKWMYRGKEWKGGKTYSLTVALNEIAVFERKK